MVTTTTVAAATDPIIETTAASTTTSGASVLGEDIGAAQAPGGRLPRTGGSPGRFLSFGALLLFCGVGLCWFGAGRGRRRRSDHNPNG